jgi:hypothetical protein
MMGEGDVSSIALGRLFGTFRAHVGDAGVAPWQARESKGGLDAGRCE